MLVLIYTNIPESETSNWLRNKTRRSTELTEFYANMEALNL